MEQGQKAVIMEQVWLMTPRKELVFLIRVTWYLKWREIWEKWKFEKLKLEKLKIEKLKLEKL